ncbi:hypothetical protein PENTCL1PPCAC_4410, partial [Pristionchus entomophagus]
HMNPVTLQLHWAAQMLQLQQAAAMRAASAAAAANAVALTPPNENSPPMDMKPTTPPGEQIELRQFLLQLLQEGGNLHLIRWTNKDEQMFKLVNPQEVARRWGEQTGHPGMNYEKMSRTLRFNYQRKTIEKVGKQFEYRFLGLPDTTTKKISPRRIGRRHQRPECESPSTEKTQTTIAASSPPPTLLQPLQPLNLQHLLQLQNLQSQLMVQRALLPLSMPFLSLLHSPPDGSLLPLPPQISPRPQFSVSSILGLTQDKDDQSILGLAPDQDEAPADNDDQDDPADPTHDV